MHRVLEKYNTYTYLYLKGQYHSSLWLVIVKIRLSGRKDENGSRNGTVLEIELVSPVVRFKRLPDLIRG